MALFSEKSNADWLREYAQSHQHPKNRLCHSIGIPVVALSVVLGLLAIFVRQLWPFAAGFFLMGWTLQFIGHAYERKLPEFFKDWRFLFVGLRWWFAKVRRRA